MAKEENCKLSKFVTIMPTFQDKLLGNKPQITKNACEMLVKIVILAYISMKHTIFACGSP